MSKRNKKPPEIWLCDNAALCSRCKRRLRPSRRYLWWFEELSGLRHPFLTDVLLCSSCQRLHVPRGQHLQMVNGQPFMLPVHTQDACALSRHPKNAPELSTGRGVADSTPIAKSGVEPTGAPGRTPIATPTTAIPRSRPVSPDARPRRFKGRSGKMPVISRKERNLLIHSQIVADDHPWLLEFLGQRDHAGEADIRTLPHDHQVFVKDMLGDLLKQCPQEWKGDSERPAHDLGDDKNDWTTCSLCGQRNRYVFFIVNRLNDWKLNVGSDCIKEFDFDLGPINRTVAQLRTERARMRRRTKLNELWPGIASVIDSWPSSLDKYPILIPARLERPYLACGTEARTTYDGLVSGKQRDGAIERLRDLFLRRSDLLERIDKYVAEADQNSPFAATRAVARWVINQQDEQTLQWLKEDGEITYRCACRIMHPPLMAHIVEKMSPVMEELSIIFHKHNETGYIFSVGSHTSIKLHIRHTEFMTEYGGSLFGAEHSTVDALNLINMSAVYGRTSLERVIDRISSLLNPRGYSLVELAVDYNELVFKNRGTKTHHILSLKPSVHRYKPLAFGLNQDDLLHLMDEIDNAKTRLTEEDYLDRQASREGFGKRWSDATSRIRSDPTD